MDNTKQAPVSHHQDGVNDALHEIRENMWTRQTAKRWLAAIVPYGPTTREEIREYSRGYESTIASYADNTLNLSTVMESK